VPHQLRFERPGHPVELVRGDIRGDLVAGVSTVVAAGVAAVSAKDWPEVIARMGKVVARDPKNADARNYMGYAYRQMGEMDKSFENYEIALRLDPKHRDAREYLGEAYLMVGKLAQAEEQLKALDKLCFFPCEQYTDLKERIARYRLEHLTKAAP